MIASDYIESGKVLFIQKNYNFLATQSETGSIKDLITYNLFSDKQLALRYTDPMEARIIYTSEQSAKDFSADDFWLPYSVMMLFYILIIGASSMMLNSITHEKQNRVIEILLTSISTREMADRQNHRFGPGRIVPNHGMAGQQLYPAQPGRQAVLPAGIFLSFPLHPGLGIGVLRTGLRALQQPDGRFRRHGPPAPKEGSQATMVVIFPA